MFQPALCERPRFSAASFWLCLRPADMMQAHKAEGFKWWAQRLGRSFQLYDETRIDHFRGFAGTNLQLYSCATAVGLLTQLQDVTLCT